MARIPWPVKWLVAPIVAGLLGYWVIGPRLAGRVKVPEAVKQSVGKFVRAASSDSTPPKEGSSEAAPSPPPSVTTDAEPMAAQEERPRRRRRHRRDEE